MKKNKSYKKYQIIGIIISAACIVAMTALCLDMNSAIGNMRKEETARKPEAVLARAGVSEDKTVFLNVMYYDQREDGCVNLYDVSQGGAAASRQFEWESCGYFNKGIEKGLVSYELGENHLPVFSSGRLTPNRGLSDAERWFSAVDEKSASYTGTIGMQYRTEGTEFYFNRERFYPLDEAEFSKTDAVNEDGHNHLFTMNFAIPFTAMVDGRENFEITADDDTFVYVDEKLAIDMGGVHDATTGRFEIHDDGEVYAGVDYEEPAFTGISLDNGKETLIRIFHADRDASDSRFGVKLADMNIAIMDTRLASGEEGVQVAYDPTNSDDPAYAKPLGQSVERKADHSRGYMLLATIEGITIALFAVLVIMSVRVVAKKKTIK